MIDWVKDALIFLRRLCRRQPQACGAGHETRRGTYESPRLVHPRRRQQAGAAQVTGRPPKITREQYLLLRMRAASGVKHRILAREYGLTRQSVQRIAREGLKHYEVGSAQP